jgi:glycosyltransferase involved in cell wall biosynthesis
MTKIVCINRVTGSYIREYGLYDNILFLSSKTFLKRYLEIKKIIVENKINIIWTWGGLEATFGLLLSMNTPVHHINGSIRHGIVRINTNHCWRKIVLHLSRHIIANSYSGLRANRLTRGFLLYNGLDEKFFQPVIKENYLQDNPDIKQMINKEGLVFISVANLVPYKDYFTVLHALGDLKKAGYIFTYLVVGQGPNRNHIEADIIRNGLNGDVYLLGQRSDVKELLSISDLFIHSSLGEGCSNAILEAMAVGLPVIATSTGGSPEIIDESYGRLFEYQNWEQLKSHLNWFLNNPERREEMGFSAKETARNRFSVERMMVEYKQIIFQIAAN